MTKTFVGGPTTSSLAVEDDYNFYIAHGIELLDKFLTRISYVVIPRRFGVVAPSPFSRANSDSPR